MLIKAALVIVMTGLMTHIGDDTVAGPDFKSAAAIVLDKHDTHHHPTLMVRKCFVNETDANDVEYHLQPNDRIKFRHGVSLGYAETSTAFVQYTPSLAEPLTNSLVDEPIKDTAKHGNVVAWLEYPEGMLDIFWYHTAKAKFFRGSNFVRNQCVPKATYFAATTTDVVFIDIHHDDGSTTTIPLKQDALVEITNQGDIPLSTDNVAGSAHFANYSGLLERRFGIVPKDVARVESGTRCEQSPTLSGPITTRRLAARLSTQFPTIAAELAMGGDCDDGNVGFEASEHPACTNTDWP
jgi:hypothetical protein